MNRLRRCTFRKPASPFAPNFLPRVNHRRRRVVVQPKQVGQNATLESVCLRLRGRSPGTYNTRRSFGLAPLAASPRLVWGAPFFKLVAMITSVTMWHCKCGTNVKAVTEMDRANIDHPDRLNAVCPKCGETQIIYGHRLVIVTGDNTPKAPTASTTG